MGNLLFTLKTKKMETLDELIEKLQNLRDSKPTSGRMYVDIFDPGNEDYFEIEKIDLVEGEIRIIIIN